MGQIVSAFISRKPRPQRKLPFKPEEFQLSLIKTDKGVDGKDHDDGSQINAIRRLKKNLDARDKEILNLRCKIFELQGLEDVIKGLRNDVHKVKHENEILKKCVYDLNTVRDTPATGAEGAKKKVQQKVKIV